MPLYERTYLRYEGPRTSRYRRSLALAFAETRLFLKQRSFLLLLALCWVPAVVRAVSIYIAFQIPSAASVLSVDDRLFQEFLGWQVAMLPVLLVSLYVGAGAVANDVAAGALVVYLSKPISRWDYLLGKALPLLGALTAITVLPALALLALALSLAQDLTLLRQAPALPFSIVAYGLWISVYFTLAVLALSSTSRSARMAGAGFAAVALGSEAFVRFGLGRVLEGGPPLYLSMVGAAYDVGNVFFARPSEGTAPYSSLSVMTLTLVGALLLLGRRLRSPEGGP